MYSSLESLSFYIYAERCMPQCVFAHENLRLKVLVN